MAENQDKLRHDCVSQHAFVCRERTPRSRPCFSASFFYSEASASYGRVSQASQGCMSQTLTSRGNLSPANPSSYEALEAQEEEHVSVVDPVPDSFLRGLMKSPYFLSMQNMLLDMCRKEGYIYLLLRYICFILIEL